MNIRVAGKLKIDIQKRHDELQNQIYDLEFSFPNGETSSAVFSEKMCDIMTYMKVHCNLYIESVTYLSSHQWLYGYWSD